LFGLAMVALRSQPAEADALWKSARDAAHRKQSLVHSKQETQPAPPPPVIAPGKPHDVVISRSRYAEVARHIDDAQRQGQSSIVHIDRAGGAERRRPSTGSVDRHRKPRPLHERDEYPSALVREGMPNANVRNIPRSDNRGAGSGDDQGPVAAFSGTNPGASAALSTPTSCRQSSSHKRNSVPFILASGEQSTCHCRST
jgi:hypothetical protein